MTHRLTLSGISIGPENIKSDLFPEGFSHHSATDEILKFLKEWWNESDEIELKTSGSTGVPKIIKRKKEQLINSAQMTLGFFDLKEGDKVLHCLPSSFIAGKMMIVRAIIGRLDLIPITPSADPIAEENLENISFCAMTPFQVSNSLHSNPKGLESIEKLIIGGGEISASLEEKLRYLSNSIYATYGMTETLSHVALRKIGEESYTLLKGIKADVDQDNRLIVLAPQLGAERLITNDVVEFTDLNKFIFKGRWDNVINTGGLKVHPEELEEKVNPLLDPRRFVFSAQKENALGEMVVLVLEGEELDGVTEHLLLNHLREILPGKMAPKAICYLDQFPETENGKIRREAIKAAINKV